MYNDGLVRFATKPFNTNPKDLGDKFIHLTNYAINKDNENFLHNTKPEECQGHKWSVLAFWNYLEKRGIPRHNVWEKIEAIIVKTITCVRDDILNSYNKHHLNTYNCYKLFGVDILLDDKLKPWLLEVNNYPSLCLAPIDRHVNDAMLTEVFNIVGFHLTSRLKRKQKTIVSKYYGFSPKVLDFVPGMHVPRLDKCVDSAIEEQNLKSDDIRSLIQAEEELSQTKGFVRLLPSIKNSMYLNFVEEPSRSDKIMAAWEEKYSDNRKQGRELINKLCQEGKHMEGVEETLKHYWNTY